MEAKFGRLRVEFLASGVCFASISNLIFISYHSFEHEQAESEGLYRYLINFHKVLGIILSKYEPDPAGAAFSNTK